MCSILDGGLVKKYVQYVWRSGKEILDGGLVSILDLVKKYVQYLRWIVSQMEVW